MCIINCDVFLTCLYLVGNQIRRQESGYLELRSDPICLSCGRRNFLYCMFNCVFFCPRKNTVKVYESCDGALKDMSGLKLKSNMISFE